MADACAGGGELDFATLQVLEIAHAVFVFEDAVDDVTEDEEFGVTVSSETSACLHPVLVDNPERTKALMSGIVVRRERERVVCV